MSLTIKEINPNNSTFFYFKKLNNQYLLTNDIGEYSFLNPDKFKLFLNGKTDEFSSDIRSDLISKYSLSRKRDLGGFINKFASKNDFGRGPDLHIIVVTLRCDHKCLYCQANSTGLKAKEFDMGFETARQVVDKIFEFPSKVINIEFQGGEPLVNFNTVKFIVNYAGRKNKIAKKKLIFSIVTNFTFMNKMILDYAIRHKIRICTSLDGPDYLHNKCRISRNGKNTYKNTVKWLRKLKLKYKNKNIQFQPAALATITKFSLGYPREIVNEYLKLGLTGLHLRPMSLFSFLPGRSKKDNYSAEEFVNFYKKALDYIISLNKQGEHFYERTAMIFLTKILTDRDAKYLDLRSPCGAGIGQLAYNFNGDIYSCDEGRMLARMGDNSFKIGSIKDFSYDKLINSQIVKSMCAASCLDNIPGCSLCAYKPYCGVCPICNHWLNHNIFNKANFLCKINSSILDYLFLKLQDDKIREIFSKWVGIKNQETVL